MPGFKSIGEEPIGASPSGSADHVLSPNDLQHSHTIEQPSVTITDNISPNDLQHGHTIEQATFTEVEKLSSNDLQHGHTIEQPTLTEVVQIVSNDLQHGHTIENAPFTEVELIASNDLQHGHTLEQPSWTQNHNFSSNDLQHGHTLDGTIIVTEVIVFSPNSLQHNHTIEEPDRTFYTIWDNSLAFTQALQAQQTGETIIKLLRLFSDEMEDDILVTSDSVKTEHNGEEYVPFPFKAEPHGQTQDKAPTVQLVIDNVDRRITEELRKLSSPLKVEFKVVLASQPDVVEVGPYTFTLRNVKGDKLEIRGDLQFDQIRDIRYPADTFQPVTFPGLF